MSEQIIVNVTAYETRLALLNASQVMELFVERHTDRGIVGNIYLGKVQRVLPGMQAAFVEIGLEKAAFLYVGDVVPNEHHHDDDEPATIPPEGHDASEGVASGEGAPVDDAPAPRRRSNKGRSERRIEQLLKQGQTVLVQVAKDAIGTKGPRVTCNISLPGRHLVYMPAHDHVGVSRRITDDAERARLRALLVELRPPVGGFVVRTVSEGLSREKLAEDVEFLSTLWQDVQKRAAALSPPGLVQPELDLVLRAARDLLNGDVARMVVDDEDTFARVKRFVELRDPSLVSRVELYVDDAPLFEHVGIEAEIARAMSRKVWLKSGGTLVIDQAEALTAIDVNTGRFVGRRNLEDTILRTNLEAVAEVADQLRLRNIGGMVIIDFIDMEVDEHRQRVLRALSDALKRDRARCNVVRMSELGLVEMTRQRTRESLNRQLNETCWYCEGRGTLRSKRTIVYDIFRTLERTAKKLAEPVVVVQAHPEVADLLVDDEADVLRAIEARVARRVLVRPRGSFHQEQFDIFGTSEELLTGTLRAAKRQAS